MVYRVYVEKREGFSTEAEGLLSELCAAAPGLKRVRLLLRYDVENISEEEFFACCTGVFADPRTDVHTFTLPEGADCAFAAEYLPGQFDDRADAAQQKLIGLRKELQEAADSGE